MKLSFVALSAVLGSAAASKGLPIRGGKPSMKSIDLNGRSIKADSKIGRTLLDNARQLENDDNDGDSSWVAGFSLKFQGCHHISQWNEEGDGEDDVRIQTKRLVRFRLCPTDSCTYSDASGCNSGYGDYIVDMGTFLQSYWENKQEFEEWNCEYYANNVCYCENANNEEYCQYDCFMENGLDYCIEENPYENNNNNNNNGDDEEEFEVDRYLECAEWDVANNNDGRRLDQDDDGMEFFIGPYCSDQGGKIFLGVFTDEYCTNFFTDEDNGYYTDTDFYTEVTGTTLPYSSESLVGMDCIECQRLDENNGNNNNNNNNNNGNNAEPLEMCEEIYENAGKCESNLADGVTYYPNTNACNYIDGIKIIRTDGVVIQQGGSYSQTASVFLGILGVSFALLGCYVWHLKSKLERSKVNLSSQ